MYRFAKSVFFRMSAERAHHLAIAALSKFPRSSRLMTQNFTPSPRLQQQLWHLKFPHPVGLAAGLDKNGVAIDGLFSCGFSFVEVGTVTPKAQPGNPSPRLFRLLEDEALINRMGFNNEGSQSLADAVRKHRSPGIVGINLGKNKVTSNDAAVEDYLKCLLDVIDIADYLVINVSSPNTPGLRDLQSEASLIPLVRTLIQARDRYFANEKNASQSTHPIPPMFLKLAPDLPNESIQAIGKELKNTGIDGFIATNTTLARDGLQSTRQGEVGGLSGRPLHARSTEVIRILYEATEGAIPIIGSGGIFNAEDAYEKIRAGASLIQIYTGFIYRGPSLIREVVLGIDDFLQRDGLATIQDAVGIDVRQG